MDDPWVTRCLILVSIPFYSSLMNFIKLWVFWTSFLKGWGQFSHQPKYLSVLLPSFAHHLPINPAIYSTIHILSNHIAIKLSNCTPNHLPTHLSINLCTHTTIFFSIHSHILSTTHLSTHSYTLQPFIHPLPIHLFTHSSTHSPIYPITYPPSYSSTYPSTYPCIYLLTHSSPHTVIQTKYSCVCPPLTYAPIRPPIHPPTHSLAIILLATTHLSSTYHFRVCYDTYCSVVSSSSLPGRKYGCPQGSHRRR